jgi:hypothetical protein
MWSNNDGMDPNWRPLETPKGSEIQRLREENATLKAESARYREALKFYAEGNGADEDDADYIQHQSRVYWFNHFGKAARKALEEK